MQRTILKRTGGVAALALSLSLGLAACSSEDADSGSDSSGSESSATEESPSEESSPSEDSSESEAAEEPMYFGAACAEVPQNGPGSAEGMADDPVATAASNNPLLETLVTAVTEADLVQTLNGLEAATVFAPTNDAFAKIPEADLNALLGDKPALTTVLTHHVLPERVDPSDLAGDQTTVAEDTVTIEGEGEDFTIPAANGGEEANIICGNVQTANANVYVIDSVLMPEQTGGGNGGGNG
ncbi:fasciclin domain-containing protein [Nocardioides sp. CFH 31398]|uniref:fasciclin domain-containing protein n=1 Tax=Nocardioides sp. CFH 31398 TaxID=2919579 RepID=UPI001F0689C8|nr:fasciclin domain-containing protein [Nocardioides sp. CFH 31398]MCH1867969.1 fasciclin domain-containing protein [Nocardioides sp. CFH 31398]